MKRTTIGDRLQTTKGFMLIEVLFAIVIISVALIPISTMFSQAIQADLRAKDDTVAANLLQKQLELLKTYPPTQWAALTLPCTLPWSDTIQLPSPKYTLTTNARQSTVNDHLVEVTVTAVWQEKSKERKLEFVTFYSAL